MVKLENPKKKKQLYTYIRAHNIPANMYVQISLENPLEHLVYDLYDYLFCQFYKMKKTFRNVLKR